jgi:hypothetical protein
VPYQGEDCDEEKGHEEEEEDTHLTNCAGESPAPGRKTAFRNHSTLNSSRPATVGSGSPSATARKPVVPAVRALGLLEPGEYIDFRAFQAGCATIVDQCQRSLTSLQEAREQIVRLEKETADLRNNLCGSMFHWTQTGTSADMPMPEDNSLGAMSAVTTASGANTGGFYTISSPILPTTPPTPSPAAPPLANISSPTVAPSSITIPELGVHGNVEVGNASTGPMTSGATKFSTNAGSMRSPPPRKFSDIIKESEEAEHEISHFSLNQKTNVDETPDRSPRPSNFFARLRGFARLG